MSHSNFLEPASPNVSPPAAAQPRTAPYHYRYAPQPPSDEGLPVRLVVGVWARWWRLILPASVLLIAAGAAISFWTFEPQYQAFAWLQIDELPMMVVFERNDDQARRFVQTQSEMLRSRLVLEAALSDPEVAKIPEIAKRKSPAEWLAQKKLEIAPVNDSEFLQIAYTGPDPENSAKLVNAIVRAYFQLRQDLQDRRDDRVIELLEQEKQQQEQVLARMEERLRQLSKQLGTAAIPAMIPGQRDVVLVEDPLRDLQKRLVESEFAIRMLDAEIQARTEMLDEPSDPVPASALDSYTDRDPRVQELVAVIEFKRHELTQTELVAKRGKQDPTYQRKARDLHALEARLAQLRDEVRPRVQDEYRMANLEKMRDELTGLKLQRESQQALTDDLRQRIAEKVQQMEASSSAAFDLQFALADLEPQRDVLKLITERLAQMKTERSRPDRVRSLQPAVPPSEPIEPIPLAGLLFSTALGLTLPFALAFAWELSVRRITSAQQLEQQLLPGAVTEVARLPVRRALASPSNGAPPSTDLLLFEESIDSLRTALVLSHSEQDLHVLAVTSAISGEGKTSISSQLAVSLARSSNTPVLLIDGDMRSPDIHRIFQIDKVPGLAELLVGEATLDEAINRTWSDSVHLLPAGHLRWNPHKLMGNGNFRKLLDECRMWYGFIVIDTPPVLAASEALVMAREADGALLCAMRDVSRENHVRLAYQRLTACGARPVGKVLNGVPARQYASRYGAYPYATAGET